jgi:endonuclease G, mitochondrial
MVDSRTNRLESYLSLISRGIGGTEAVLETFREKVHDGRESGAVDTVRIDSAIAALESLARNSTGSLDHAAYAAVEAIINEDMRPAIDIVGSKFNVTHDLWLHLSSKEDLRTKIERAIPAIGRIELPGHPTLPFGGTGFIVGDGLIMTNRHVAEIFTRGVGDRKLDFIPDRAAGIDFLRERDQPTGPTLAVRRIALVHPYWDVALLAVDGLPRVQPLCLSVEDARDLDGEIVVIGYPAFDSRNPASVQQTLFDHTYGVKRLQPGRLQRSVSTESYGKMVNAAAHDCSTLGGNSGSGVIDLKTGSVLALHFGGRYHQKNYGVPTYELSRDSRLIDAGVNFAKVPKGDPNDWSAWWRHADAIAAESPEVGAVSNGASGNQTSAPKGDQPSSIVMAASSEQQIHIEVPLRISVTIGAIKMTHGAVVETRATRAGEGLTEAMREPQHDGDYRKRKGYNPDFLDGLTDQPSADFRAPMPSASNAKVLAKLPGGDPVLRYQNFSILMHAKRRLALITAANVTREKVLTRPEPGRDYSRRGLSGLGKNDQERWFPDPRIDAGAQLPDAFFTKDRKAFDKGHLVRRNDIVWGETYDLLRIANGDSFHVTNCSPQVGTFNRASGEDDNWGDLENHVYSQAANERLCVFAGPVLSDTDETFLGVGDNGSLLRAKIPSRFWKVIVARTQIGIAAYGFVLKQDLSQVEWEFALPAQLRPAMTPIQEIGAMGGVAFDATILAADQFDEELGHELALRSGTRRCKPES